MKPFIYYYSDCPFFAGCENMLVNFFDNDELRSNYRIGFGYRYSKAYEEGMRNRIKSQPDVVNPLYLFEMSHIHAFANQFKNRIIQKGIKVLAHLLLIKYLFVLLNTIILYRHFKNKNIALLHVNNGGYPAAYSCMSAVIAARLAGIRKIVYVVNNIATPYNSPLRWLDYPLDKIVKKNVDLFITGSTYAADKLRSVLNLPDNGVHNIHNGIQPRMVTEEREEVLRRLNIVNQHHLIVGIVALLEIRKGHIYLIQAIKKLKDQKVSPMPLLLIEGNGSEYDHLFQKVQELDLVEEVRFIGNEKNIYNFMNAMDVLVLPSISNEDFPNVVIEAMSLGKAVIASDIAGIPEQIKHNETGLIVKPKDVQGLADAICQLEHKEVRDRIGAQAKEFFNNHFRSDISVMKYKKIYDEFIKEAFK